MKKIFTICLTGFALIILLSIFTSCNQLVKIDSSDDEAISKNKQIKLAIDELIPGETFDPIIFDQSKAGSILKKRKATREYIEYEIVLLRAHSGELDYYDSWKVITDIDLTLTSVELIKSREMNL